MLHHRKKCAVILCRNMNYHKAMVYNTLTDAPFFCIILINFKTVHVIPRDF